MTGLDIFALVVLVVIAASVGAAAIVLARLPGQIAAKRGHPQADAIAIAGWLGILAAGVLWPLALIWAYSRPPLAATALKDLQDRVAMLEARMAARQGAAE